MSKAEVIKWFGERGVLADHIPGIIDHLTFSPTIRLLRTGALRSSAIGAYSYVSPRTIMNSVTLGRYCSIGARCELGPSQHPTDWVTTSPIPYRNIFPVGSKPAGLETHNEFTPITIGNDVWIGTSVAVMSGVTIGDGAIVAYGSVVTRNVEPYTIVGGTPARPIRRRFADQVVERLLREAWWNRDLVRTTHPIAWRDPMQALDNIVEGVASGAIADIQPTRYRITRSSGTFSCKKLV